MQTSADDLSSAEPSAEDLTYKTLLDTLRQRIGGPEPLFRTDATDLWATFLDALPTDRRRHYDCRTCQSFVERFGGLVRLTESGATLAVLWDPKLAQGIFFAAVFALRTRVQRAKVTGVFYSTEKMLGSPMTTVTKAPFRWHHLATELPDALLFTSLEHTPHQEEAVRLVEVEVLERAMADFEPRLFAQAHALLVNDKLPRSEKALGAAQWAMELANELSCTPRERQRNLLWRAVALAPTGFATFRNHVLGKLLEDLKAGLPYEEILRRFTAMMDPSVYQRPQTLPAAGNVAAAEKLVSKLGVAAAFRRRFARLVEIPALWRPKATDAPPAGGVFGHLRTKDETPPSTRVPGPPTVMTWEKFARTVLPDAEQLAFFAVHEPLPLTALLTAIDPAAPSILQWDTPAHRNPFSWYFYKDGSLPEQWNLPTNAWVRVTALALAPSMWRDPNAHPNHGKRIFFFLNGARDLSYLTGAGFFPEMLKSEFHPIRETMEAYAKSAIVEGAHEADACGVAFTAGRSWKCHLRVVTKHATFDVQLDRWD